jgi:hypothetical protein
MCDSGHHRFTEAPPQPSGLKARDTLAWGKAPGSRPTTSCGLKARDTLAWGNAPGHPATTPCGPKARAKSLPRHLYPRSQPSSIPNKPLVKHHTILCKHRPHLALKISPLMVHGLPIDIPHQRVAIAQPHRKRRIPALPTELRELGSPRLDPLGRRDLHPLHQTRHRFRSSNKHGQMHMVRNPTYANANVLFAVQHRRKVRMHVRANAVAEQRQPSLRAEHDVYQNVRKRLRHGGQYSAGLQRATGACLTTWGAAPGYISTGLQPEGYALLDPLKSSHLPVPAHVAHSHPGAQS